MLARVKGAFDYLKSVRARDLDKNQILENLTLIRDYISTNSIGMRSFEMLVNKATEIIYSFDSLTDEEIMFRISNLISRINLQVKLADNAQDYLSKIKTPPRRIPIGTVWGTKLPSNIITNNGIWTIKIR